MTQVTGGQKTTAVIQPDDISYKETGLSKEEREMFRMWGMKEMNLGLLAAFEFEWLTNSF